MNLVYINIGKLIKVYRKQIILVTGGFFIALSVLFFILGSDEMRLGNYLLRRFQGSLSPKYMPYIEYYNAERNYHISFIFSTLGWIIFSIGLSMKRFNITEGKDI